MRTLGMRKFGRPDLELINAGKQYYYESSNLEFANRIIKFQINGAFMYEKGEIKIFSLLRK